MQWFFLSATQEQVPVSEDHIAGLVQTGVIRSNTMIWREGMPQWVACSEVRPELFAQPQVQQGRQVTPVVGAVATARQHTAAMQTQQVAGRVHPGATAQMQGGEQSFVREIASAFARGAGWMKFLGVLSQLAGILLLLGVLVMLIGGGAVGGPFFVLFAVIGLFYATMGGIMLWLGIVLFQSATKSQDAVRTGRKHSLLSALSSNAKFFKIWGVIASIGVVINVGAAVVTMTSGGIAALMGMSSDPGIDFSEFDNNLENLEGFGDGDGVDFGDDDIGVDGEEEGEAEGAVPEGFESVEDDF